MSNTPLAFEAQVLGTIQKTLAPNATGTSTTETAFLNNGNSITSTAASVIPLSTGNPGLFVGGSYSLSTLTSTGLPFRIRLYGFCKSGGTQNLTISVYQVPAASISGLTATSFTGATKIATTSTKAVNSTTGAFYGDITCQAVALSTTSVTLQGQSSWEVNNSTVAATNNTAVTGLIGEADLNFFVTSTLSGGNTGDTVTLTGFQLEVV